VAGNNRWCAIFDPAELQFNKYDANPVIGNVLLFNGAFRMQDYSSGIKNFNGLFLEPKLPHNKNSITFKFQSVSLTIPAKNKCRYRLLGYSSTWNMPRVLMRLLSLHLLPENMNLNCKPLIMMEYGVQKRIDMYSS
jgi:hypothetical protein